MYDLYHNPLMPEVLETTYILDDVTRQRMINTVLSQKDTANYHGGYTFHIEDMHGDFDKLYNYFFSVVESIFGPIDLAAKHKPWCWANVYNKDNFKTNAHNHIHTASINAVYYLKISNDMLANEGGLNLYPFTKPIIQFQPDEGDLLIMPNYTVHEPLFHSGSDYRIAVNMEICINSHINDYYKEEKIYANVNPKI
jgi:hypothetical protein